MKKNNVITVSFRRNMSIPFICVRKEEEDKNIQYIISNYYYKN